MIKKIFTLILALSTLLINAQERCGTEVITKQMMVNNPDYALARSKVNVQTEQWIKNNPNYNQKTIITIPVVVHVVWKTNTQNISDAQIQSQIDVLNEDFRRTNIDNFMTPSVWQSIATDCEIEFCLAQTDPNGAATTGITRTETSQTSFSMSSNNVKSTSNGGINPWPKDDYLNIWVCNLGGGLLGYATPPSSWSNPNDGVVIGYNYFGNMGTATTNPSNPYRKGRTATHEVGHWLNLDHLWGNGNCDSDQVSDTPQQDDENYTCGPFPLQAVSCNTTGANGTMFTNYMDYTNDACMNLFTNGQKTRMLAAINSYRQNMLSHNLCDGSVGVSEQINNTRKLIKIVDVLGRKTNKLKTNTPLLYIYDDGSVEKMIINRTFLNN